MAGNKPERKCAFSPVVSPSPGGQSHDHKLGVHMGYLHMAKWPVMRRGPWSKVNCGQRPRPKVHQRTGKVPRAVGQEAPARQVRRGLRSAFLSGPSGQPFPALVHLPALGFSSFCCFHWLLEAITATW